MELRILFSVLTALTPEDAAQAHSFRGVGKCPKCFHHRRQRDSYMLERNSQETRLYWLPEVPMLHSIADFKTFGHQADDDESFWVTEGILEGCLEK